MHELNTQLQPKGGRGRERERERERGCMHKSVIYGISEAIKLIIKGYSKLSKGHTI